MQPQYPFQCTCADFFQYAGHNYLVIVDRYSNWPIVERAHRGSTGLITSLRHTFTTYGISDELSFDGGPELTSSATTTVPAQLLSPSPPLNQTLAYRPQCEYLEGHSETLYQSIQKNVPHKIWQETLANREEALRNRHMQDAERLSAHIRILPPLTVGDHIRKQNQTGSLPTKWDKTGLVIGVRQFDQYVIRVDGSGRRTLSNRKFIPPSDCQGPSCHTAYTYYNSGKE